MAKRESLSKKPIEQYDHKGKKRLNNPPVGLVTPDTDKDTGQKKQYQYDPHLDPQLVWAGKAEHTSFEVPTVSLHVHERIDPKTIIEAVRKKNGSQQPGLFDSLEENPPLRDAIQFYKHAHNWSNRLIAGDSLLVMNSLLEKEGLAGQIQTIYIDPPYGIKYGSNFQPFINKRDVKDGRDEDLTAEPEQIRAFRDTWELGIHSYLAYLRDRLLLAKELLSESGSCFVQISDENIHHVRELMDEVFEESNFVGLVCIKKSGMMLGNLLKSAVYYLIWYARNIEHIKYHKLLLEKSAGTGIGKLYDQLESPDSNFHRRMTDEEIANPELIPDGWRAYQLITLTTGGFRENTTVPYEFDGKIYHPGPDKCWRTTTDGLDRLKKLGRIQTRGNLLYYKSYLDDFPAAELTSIWADVESQAEEMLYVVQTPRKAIARCLLMTTDPGDLVFDPTCGSGTTAYVAEQWGRRWLTCDTSRVALTLAKQRLMTALFDYYDLAHPSEGVSSGFKYKTVPHVTLKSIANNEPPGEETLYDKPFIDNSKARVTGPFTVEAVPAQTVKPLDALSPITALCHSREGGNPEDIQLDTSIARSGETLRQSLPSCHSERSEESGPDTSIVRSGETLRQSEWRDELLKTGIRGKAGQKIEFSRVELIGGTRWLHADAETKTDKPERVLLSFGPEHAPLERRQVESAIQEARNLVPKPSIVVFAAFQFDPEAAKDIDETDWPGVTLLKAQMNADLLTDDLKKKRSSNESFWLIGQPDVRLSVIASPPQADEAISKRYQVEVLGFDYYNTRTGNIDSGGTNNIAMWLLDTDYDGRSVYPRQVFFPLADEDKGWARLARNLKAEIDPELVEAYRGTVSLPFAAGDNKRIAVKIIDDRGIESLRILDLE